MKRNILLVFIFFSLTFQFLFANELLDAASGKNHSLLLFKNGKILPYGDNSFGQLGLSKTIDNQSITKKNPLYVDIPIKFISIAVGLDFSLAVAEDGSLWGWGNNRNYQLGLSNPQNIEEPQLLSKIKGWKKVFAGGYEALALKEDGNLWNLRDFEIIKNPNEVIWKDVKIFGDMWGFGDYTLIVILQDITNKFWVYGTCTDSLDNLSILNSFINKNISLAEFNTIQPINISSDATDFQVTDLSGIYKDSFGTAIFGLSVADNEKIIKILNCKEPIYDYLSKIIRYEKNKKINEIVIGNFTDKTILSLDISKPQNNLHYYSYSALLQNNGRLTIYTNGEKKISDKKIKIKKIFGGNNIFVQGKDSKIYGIGYFYSDLCTENSQAFLYFVPVNY